MPFLQVKRAIHWPVGNLRGGNCEHPITSPCMPFAVLSRTDGLSNSRGRCIIPRGCSGSMATRRNAPQNISHRVSKEPYFTFPSRAGIDEEHHCHSMNGFAINSSLIGEGREIHGPKYISDGWTGAETVSKMRLKPCLTMSLDNIACISSFLPALNIYQTEIPRKDLQETN